jgi:hypothetical protein
VQCSGLWTCLGLVVVPLGERAGCRLCGVPQRSGVELGQGWEWQRGGGMGGTVGMKWVVDAHAPHAVVVPLPDGPAM